MQRPSPASTPRRNVLRGLLAAPAAALLSGPACAAGARRTVGLRPLPEISASLYPWDLGDEGTDDVMDLLGETAYCNSAYLVALMHAEKRPYTDFYFPHNPRRKIFVPEDSRIFWVPRDKHYGRIKPLVSADKAIRDTDWVETLAGAARKRGWRTGAELSHTILDHERAYTTCADVLQRDVFGNPLSLLVCPNHPDGRAYLIGLICDLVANHDLDFVQTCVVPFSARGLPAAVGLGGAAHKPGTFAFRGHYTWIPGASPLQALLEVARGGCFCESCHVEARARGFDLAKARARILPLAESLDHGGVVEGHVAQLLQASNVTATAWLLRHPALIDWLAFRIACMTDLFRVVSEAARAVKPGIDIRLNAYVLQNQELSGLDLSALKPHLGSIRSSDYSEQQGRADALQAKAQFLLAIRHAVGDDMHMLSAIGIRPAATPALIQQGIAVSARCGADGLSLGHYDGAAFSHLKAFGQGLNDADVAVFRPHRP